MKLIALAAAALLTTTPALAQTNANFVGPRAELDAGYNNIHRAQDFNDVVYGAEVGADIPLGDRLVVGAEANANNVFQRNRTIGVAGRVGYAITPNLLGYVKGGYANYRNTYRISANRTASQNLDGAALGGGAELALNRHAYVKGEYRHTYLNQHVGENAGLAGIGLRF